MFERTLIYATIPLRCSVTGDRFALVFWRQPGEAKLRLKRHFQISGVLGTSRDQSDIPIRSIEWSDVACPGCEHREPGGLTTVVCPFCGETLCAATLKGEQFSCLCGQQYSTVPIAKIPQLEAH